MATAANAGRSGVLGHWRDERNESETNAGGDSSAANVGWESLKYLLSVFQQFNILQ